VSTCSKPHNPDSKSGDKTDSQTSADDKGGSKGSLESVTEPADKDDKVSTNMFAFIHV